MSVNRTRLLRVLLVLLLAVGPLKAHSVFACDMMGAVMVDACCCEDIASERHDDCAAGACAAADRKDYDPCCSVSALLGTDIEARDAATTLKPWQPSTDVDPPDQYALSAQVFAPGPAGSLLYVTRPIPRITSFAGSQTYLLTRRLRI